MKNTSSELSSSSSTDYEVSGDRDGDKTKPPSNGSQRDVMKLVFLFTTMAISCFLVYNSSSDPLMVLPPWKMNWFSQNQTSFKPCEHKCETETKKKNFTKVFEKREPVSELERVLMNAAMEDKTVIITALNEAWVAPNSIFNLFLESFRIGIGTEKYINHLIGVCVDNKAYERCLQLHPHCYLINATDYDQVSGANSYMTPGYLKLIWRRMEFLREVLALGYNFLFTDADILWFRDPFPRFFPDVDFQIACDHYNGNFSSKSNWVNSGLTYVKANNKTIKFYEYWCNSRFRFRGRRKHDQDVFNLIKRDPFVDQIGIKIRFLDTVHIGTFCEPNKDINVVNTMHANCCKGLKNKFWYLSEILSVWKQYLSESSLGNTIMAEKKWKRRRRCGRNVK